MFCTGTAAELGQGSRELLLRQPVACGNLCGQQRHGKFLGHNQRQQQQLVHAGKAARAGELPARAGSACKRQPSRAGSAAGKRFERGSRAEAALSGNYVQALKCSSKAEAKELPFVQVRTGNSSASGRAVATWASARANGGVTCTSAEGAGASSNVQRQLLRVQQPGK